MKRLVPILLIALTVTPGMMAKRISSGDADVIATQFMQRKHLQAPIQMQTNTRAEISANQAYYIYNSPAGGYVIVSGDDRFGEILGYSDTGTLNLSKIPEGLSYLLDLYSMAFDSLESSNYDEGIATIDATPTVEPLLGSTNWGQAAPFNSKTPIVGGTTHYYTGCVVAAVTQIMKYYNYPAQGFGSKSYTDPLSKNNLSVDFSQSVYAWENMPAIVPDEPTQAQIDAYSKLAADFGIAVEMQYTTAGSGTYNILVPYALREYFGYDEGVRLHQRKYYPTSEWMEMIKRELNEGRPVFYGATSDVGGDGHAFVLDGYDSNDFVHVNWGWYGSSNGYFKINHLDPEILGIGGGNGGYNLNQDMVTGIQPAKEGSKRDQALYGEVRLSVSGPTEGKFTLITYIGNWDVTPVEVRVEGALVKDGKLVKKLGGGDFKIAGFNNATYGMSTVTLREVTSDGSGVEDGAYNLNMVFQPKGDDSWYLLRHPKGMISHAEVEVKDGVIVPVNLAAWSKADVVLLTPIETDEEFNPGDNALLSFTMENKSPDFPISKICMRLTSVKDSKILFDSSVDKDVYEQSVETLSLTFPISEKASPGSYYLTLYVPGRGDEIFEFDDSNVGRPIVKILGEVEEEEAEDPGEEESSEEEPGDEQPEDEDTGIESIFDNHAPLTIWVDKGWLRVIGANDAEVKCVDVYSLSGTRVSHGSFDLTDLPKGIYVVKVVLNDGRIINEKINL